MEKQEKISRRTFLGRSLTGLAALSFVPMVDLWAQERATVAEWAPNASLYRFHLIGHGHIDPVWLWSWREGLSVVMSTFRAALDRMEENPEFKFTASSALFYRWVAENDPDMMRKIRKRIDEGRWDVVGGWWIEPDVNMPSGEALARQGLYGQLELEKWVGRRARTAFLPDSFGHSNSLPQIIRQQGMDRYVFMRPMAHEKQMPADIFWWEGPDGSRLLAYRIQIGYSNSRDIRERLERIMKEFGQQPTHTYMAFYGAGDHGGGPTKRNFQQVAEIRQQGGAPTLIYSTPDDYFDEIEREGLDLPVVKDNLRNHAVGCYSVESAIKKGNRQSETALVMAEKIAAVGSVAWSAAYPQPELTRAWEKVLFLQFHDSLAGSSQAEHSEVARHGYGYAMETADTTAAMALQKLEWQIASEDPESEYVVVFNPHAWELPCDVEYDLNIKEHARPLDETGRPLPYQWTVGSSQSESVKKLIFRTTLPAMGYRQIRVVKEETAATPETDLKVSERTLENRWLKVTFSYDGEVGILDKTTGRQTFSGGDAGCKALVLHDASDTWGHGVVVYDDLIGAFGNAQFKVLEEGPLRGMIRVTTTYGNSTLTIDWILYAESREVDARVRLDWQEKNKILKFSFPVDLTTPKATFEAPYASMEPMPEGREEPGHRWIDLSGESWGFSVINDAKYGYCVNDNDMRITVVRSPVYAHNAPNKLDPAKEYPWMDQGIQTFRMKLLPHDGDWRQADLPRRAETFMVPPISTYQGIHEGHLPKKASFLEMESPSVIVTAIKQAEKGDDLIIRCVETTGQKASATLHLRMMNQTWQGEFSPYEIKTLRVDRKNARIRIVNLLEE